MLCHCGNLRRRSERCSWDGTALAIALELGDDRVVRTRALNVAFHDSDAATGGADHDLVIADTIELGDRKDLLDDFLKATHLRKAELRLDTVAAVDAQHRGKQRVVARGTGSRRSRRACAKPITRARATC